MKSALFALGATSLKHKEVLTQMEHDAPGTKLHFYVSFLKAKEEDSFVSRRRPLLGCIPVCAAGSPRLRLICVHSVVCGRETKWACQWWR
jgi:hypothetical protein